MVTTMSLLPSFHRTLPKSNNCPVSQRRDIRPKTARMGATATTTQVVEALTPAQRFQQLLTLTETAANMPIAQAPGCQILGPVDGPEQAKILSVEAQKFVATLNRCFNNRRKELLARRVTRQYEIDAGVPLGMFKQSH